MTGFKKNKMLLEEKQFLNLYLPNIKNEDWQYTNLKKQLGNIVALQPFNSNHDKQLVKGLFKKHKELLNKKNILFFVDGKFEESLSSAPNGLIIKKLSSQNNNVNSLYLNKKGDGFSVGNSDSYLGFDDFIKKNKLVELNALLTDSPYVLRFDKNFKSTSSIQIIYAQSNPSQLFNQVRTLFFLEKNVNINIHEEVINLGENESGLNLVSEIICSAGSSLNMYSTQNDSTNSCLIRSFFFLQKKKSVVNFHTLSLDGKLIRNNILSNLTEENCDCSVLGTSFLNTPCHLDNFVKISHLEKNCTSNQLFKSVYGGKSSGVFCGKIFVAKKAQKTQAFQQNKNLMISKLASVNTKPQLEIFADDVVCSHGCTIGDIDKNALFYLRSRGLSKERALKLLIIAFLNDMLSNIKNKALKEYFITLFLQKQPHA